MSLKLNPKEVLMYLNELGYTNINAQQLKEFLIDLKKLIKYEEKKKNEQVLHAEFAQECLKYPDRLTKSEITEDNDIFGQLYNKATIASKAKSVVLNKERKITLKITKPKYMATEVHGIEKYNNTHSSNSTGCYKCTGQSPHIILKCGHDTVDNTPTIIQPTKQQPTKDLSSQPQTTRSTSNKDTEISLKTVPPCSAATLVDKDTLHVKPTKSKDFIKICPAPKLKKSDPVALYHQYQKTWKHINIPGETNRSDLRWAVREKMLGQMLGCVLCILGSTVMVIHAPKEEQVESLDDFFTKLGNPAFINYVFIIFGISVAIIFYVGPRYGNRFVTVYVTLCSAIGSLTVMACKGLGLAIKSHLTDNADIRMNIGFTLLLLIFVIFFILVQMNYLNKALDLYSTNVVTPIYYVMFTTLVIIASAILFKEWQSMQEMDVLGAICGFFIVVIAIFLLLNNLRDDKLSHPLLRMNSNVYGISSYDTRDV